MFARYLASRSDRAQAPFVMVVGSTLSPSDYAAQLFGEPGRPGALKRAAGGFLFISEIQNMSPEAQQALLAVLEQREYRCAHENVIEPFDVRILGSPGPGFDRSQEYSKALLSHLQVIVTRVAPVRTYSA